MLRSVDELSPRNRAATLLFYYEQLSVREIAATLGVSVAAVKGRLHKSRGRLRELLLPAVADLGYAGTDTERRREMVEVTIADIVQSGTFSQFVVVLFDEAGRRILPIWMGPKEGSYIAVYLSNQESPRPLTPKFMADVLTAVGGELDEVRIEEIKDDTFFAVAKVRNGDTVREVDARPSDALALAAIKGSPIYVADEVMDKAGKEIPEDLGDRQPKGKGIEAIAEMSKSWSGPKHDLIAYVFGAEDS